MSTVKLDVYLRNSICEALTLLSDGSSKLLCRVPSNTITMTIIASFVHLISCSHGNPTYYPAVMFKDNCKYRCHCGYAIAMSILRHMSKADNVPPSVIGCHYPHTAHELRIINDIVSTLFRKSPIDVEYVYQRVVAYTKHNHKLFQPKKNTGLVFYTETKCEGNCTSIPNIHITQLFSDSFSDRATPQRGVFKSGATLQRDVLVNGEASAGCQLLTHNAAKASANRPGGEVVMHNSPKSKAQSSTGEQQPVILDKPQLVIAVPHNAWNMLDDDVFTSNSPSRQRVSVIDSLDSNSTSDSEVRPYVPVLDTLDDEVEMLKKEIEKHEAEIARRREVKALKSQLAELKKQLSEM